MIRLPGVLLALALALTACGAGDDLDQPPDTARSTIDAGAPPSPAAPGEPGGAAADPGAGEPAAAGSDPAMPGSTDAEPADEITSPPARLYTIQVGAFLTEASARSVAEQLERAGMPTWTVSVTVRGRTFHRVRVGASPSYTEARALGERIRREHRRPVWVAPVEDPAALPQNAVARTHALVAGG